MIVPPATYWPEIQRICRKYDILLVADEVICGFGRTGKWFGSKVWHHRRFDVHGQGVVFRLFADFGGGGGGAWLTR